MKLRVVQTVKVETTSPAEPGMVPGPLPAAEIEIMKWKAINEAKTGAKAQGAKLLEYTIHSAEVVED